MYDIIMYCQVLRKVQDKCRLFVIDEAHCLKTWGEGATKRDKPFRKLFQELANVIAKLKVNLIEYVFRTNWRVNNPFQLL